MKQKQNEEQRVKRSLLVRGVTLGLAFIMVAGLLGARLYQLQVVGYDEWRMRATQQQLSKTDITPVRGTIYDANYNVLAESITVWTVEAAPDVLAQSRLKDVTDGSTAAAVAARELAELFGLDYDTLYTNLANEEKRYYKIKAQIEKPLADEVRAIINKYNLRGIYLTQDTSRYYPYGDLAATVLGFVNDGGGVEGLENYYEDILTGTKGRSVSVVNAFGYEMPSGNDALTYDAIDGYSLKTTINAEIQAVVEKQLAWAVDYYSATERGMAIVMDVKTFAILAMATAPSYDPNDPYYIYDDATRQAIEEMPTGTEEEQQARSDAQAAARFLQWRNKAVVDTYEPGSVMKIITAAAAIDSGRYTAESPFYCGSSVHILTQQFNCAQGKAHGQITLREALIESCNVSFIEIGQTLGSHVWYDYINAFGFTEPTGIDLPGEPSLRSINNLVFSEAALENPIQLASVSFGQANKYTALQMITAVSAAVNGGYLGQPHIVSEILDANGNVVESFDPATKRQVISNETSVALRAILEDLVSDPGGNGKNAYVAGYHVGGKSGTSQKLDKLDEYGNTQQLYISSFLGFAPANDPQIAVLFVLDEPDDRDYPNIPNWFGGRLAGPSVGNIIAEVVDILGIDPDYENEEELLRSTVAAPSVAGKNFTQAQVSLNQQGLNYTLIGEGDNITGQYPSGGSAVPFGGQVILYAGGAGTAYGAVPDLTGQSAASARETLRALGFNTMTTGAPDSGDGVVVTSQDYVAGTELQLGSVITLTLSDTASHGDV